MDLFELEKPYVGWDRQSLAVICSTYQICFMDWPAKWESDSTPLVHGLPISALSVSLRRVSGAYPHHRASAKRE